MPEILNNVLQTVGLVVVAGGGLSLIIYQVFKHLAAKWLDSRFDASLQRLVHEQNKEIEKLRSGLTRSFDRASKLHHREFEVLPKVWDKVNEAYWSTRSLVSPLQTYADLDRMEPAQLEDFIDECELPQWQKDQLRETTKKTDFYRSNVYWQRLHEAKNAIRDANSSLSCSAIFMQEDLRDEIDKLLDLLWHAINEDQINHEHNPRPLLKEDIEKLNKGGDVLRKDLEQKIRARVWSHEREAL